MHYSQYLQITGVGSHSISQNYFTKEWDAGTTDPTVLFIEDIHFYIFSALHSGPSLFYPTTNASSAMPNTCGRPLNISSIFLWNMLPAGAAPYDSPTYLNLPT